MPGRGSRQPGRRVGLKDIARAADVSPAAVSYALNGTGRLEEGTRQRIIGIAKALGYRANANARNLRRRTSGVLTIAASVPPGLASMLPAMDYVMAIWQAAAAASLKRGFMLLLLPFGVESGELAGIPVDGGIVVDPVKDDPLLRHFARTDAPVVTIGRDLARPAEASWWVDNDHDALVTMALEHLRSRGARRVGAVLAGTGYAYTLAYRRAYEAWCASVGQAPMLVAVDEPATESAGYNAATGLLDRCDPPDAIFASLDRFAVGALFAAAARGLAVPDDLMIVSGNDGVATRSATVPVTALDLSPAELGRIAVDMLIDRIEGADAPRHVIVPGHLEPRASTARGG
ncbi:LacI family DNA-binding transcriptional regulator [Acuticoccus sediminis]|uniref:LacI family DNA-binding transcriptional regulator n=1 Tax=Acuticoccus sediminis TaxID=2184697 RepID=UPI001391F677|nr:LacI family DNA-binding transcriptional regulator [Acuticoccus sediminis]